MFLVETLLNLVIFAMSTVKTQKHCFPYIIISSIVPNDTHIHVRSKVSAVQPVGEELQERTKCTVVSNLR